MFTTPPVWYLAKDGKVLLGNNKHGVDTHHAFYPKSEWREGDKLHRLVSKIGGFTFRMAYDIHHDGLHSEVEPPVLTSVKLMNDLLRVQKGYQNVDPYTWLNLTLGRLQELSGSPDPQVEHEALGLIDNLKRQQVFIELGQVTRMEI